MAYTLVSGAMKNVGDFLIYEKAKMFIEKYSNESEFLELKRWTTFDNQIEEINRTKAVIICGGPGYSKRFYPNNYPFLKDYDKIKAPIIPFALGWGGEPMHRSDKFYFNGVSESIVKKIHENCEMTSCRDLITEEILNQCGFENVVMTGCPVLYDLDSIGREFGQPKELHRIVVTTAQNSIFHRQNANLMKSMKHAFPESEFYCVFHRGIEHDEFTQKTEAKHLKKLKGYAEKLGYEIVDAAYDTSKIEFYRECDLHVGYRVHAHAFFLSIRKPTFLLQEDGRGLGLSKTFELSDISVRDPTLSRIITTPKIGRYFLNRRAVQEIVSNVRAEFLNGFPRFRDTSKILDSYYGAMVDFIKILP